MQTARGPQKFQLIERLADGTSRRMPLDGVFVFPAIAGARYALIDADTGAAPKGLVVKRHGPSLLIESPDLAQPVEITQFYEEPGVAFVPQATLDGDVLTGPEITAASPATGTMAAGDPVIWTAGSDNSGLLWVGLGLGGLALAAAAGGGDDGGAPPVANTVNGTVVGGPVLAGNGLSVIVYAADGTTQLGQGKVNADGTFSIGVGSYLGVVVARVVNADTGADYLDEATGAPKDLNATLFTMEVLTLPNSTVFVNLNVLTTIAYLQAAGAAAGAPLQAAAVTQANQAIAGLFGLGDLQGTAVAPINGGNFNSTDGLSPSEVYGAVLAAFSGADVGNGGNTQQTIDAVVAGLTVTAGTATLSEAAQAVVVSGAQVTANETGTDLTGGISAIVDTFAPAITTGGSATALNETSGAGQLVYTAVATDAGPVTYSLKAGGDQAAFSINATTGAVTLTGNPDFEAKPSYTFTVVATDAAGNASEQAVTLAVNNLDEVAPAITSGAVAAAINENSGTGQVVYTATSTDVADIATGSTVYSLKAGGDRAAFTIDAGTGAVTLTGSPDFETKPSYTFTVVATDAAGNASEQAVTLAINDLVDEVAPAVGSVAISSASGAQNTLLNAGDVVNVTVTLGEATVVTGTPRVALTVGSATVYANYVSGSGTTALVFSYTVQGGDTDTNGIAVPVNGLELNGGTLRDVAGNAAVIAHAAVADNASYRVDTTAPAFTSGTTAAAVAENSGAGQAVYTAVATDAAAVTYSLKAGGDQAAFTVNGVTGAVTLTGNPNYEVKPNYTVTVVATDAAGNASEQAVTLAITNVDEAAPAITSGATAAAINENSGAGQVVYAAASTDTGDIAAGSTVYSLKAGGDQASFTINAATGAVTLTGNPDFEAKPSYTFTVVATDAAGNAGEQVVTLAVNNLDEVAPAITSGAVAAALNENSSAGQVVYTATSTDVADAATGSTVYSLKAGGDQASFTIDASTGAVTLTGSPDFETKPNYTFTVVATDAAGNASEQAVTLAVNNLDEVAPAITSGATATATNENSGAGQVIYTATSTDVSDAVTGSTVYSLKAGGDQASFSINASTGAVTLTGNPDFETKPNYTFTVVATDAAGNASEQAVTLAINDLSDETAPAVTSVAISGATGAQNTTLNAGDVVSVTVTLDEATVVTGTPRVALAIGSGTAYAVYASGSGTTALVFTYTVQSGDTDADGIAIPVNGLELNGGTLRDAAGNAAVISHGAVADDATYRVDTTAPSITSGATASAIAENSGASQAVYTAAATDSNTLTYSLKAGGDQAAFSIDGSTGVVTLTGNPDYETKPSYAFTVVATDDAGNASEQAVTLAITDVDEVAPAVSSVAITSATGAQNNRLNAGDTVNVTVTLNEATVVDVTGGVPRIALNIGGSMVNAAYVSGSGTTALEFAYTIQAAQTDANGISIGANAIDANGGTLRDAAGNNATVTHTLVADNAGYLVDTTAPTLSSSTPADNASAIAVGNNIVLNFSETVVAGTGNIVISNGVDTRTIAVGDGQVGISGSQVTINPTADLQAGTTYNVQMASGVLTDQAGNAYGGIGNATTLNFDTASSLNPAIVVFDMLTGVSSDHSSRAFQAGVAYTIYLRVDSNAGTLDITPPGGSTNTWGAWTGANNLGPDDRIVLVGSGSPVVNATASGGVNQYGRSTSFMYWAHNGSGMAQMINNGSFTRFYGGLGDSVDLWTGNLAAFQPGGLPLNDVYLTALPAGVMTSQGLL